jgi:hypothetical protein
VDGYQQLGQPERWSTAAKTGSNQVYDSAFSFNANAAKLYIEGLMSW